MLLVGKVSHFVISQESMEAELADEVRVQQLGPVLDQMRVHRLKISLLVVARRHLPIGLLK